jgi:putative N6-adenine-specific DNA methylase
MNKTERPEIFLVALPGLEDLVLSEVREVFPELEAASEHGGVTVRAEISDALAMNLILKTPTRILLRVGSFRCRDFPKLYNRIMTFPWKESVDPSCDLEIHVSTRLSRLKMKKRIEETVAKGWTEQRKKYPKKSLVKLGLFVRFLEDECTLSLDTSGERLHKRGQRVQVGEAPLRETIAASLIQWVGSLAPITRSIEVIDPMMGSGAFLIEAGSRDELVQAREFPFAGFREKPAQVTAPTTRPKIESLVGYEIDEKTLRAAKTNLDGKKANLIAKDFFAAEPLPETPLERWLFCNPPYGERLKVKEPLAEFYARLFAASERVARPDKACFLLPSKAVKGKFNLPKEWKVLAKRPFLNGGIPVTAFIFGRH